jgi:enterochelin esterase family protein
MQLFTRVILLSFYLIFCSCKTDKLNSIKGLEHQINKLNSKEEVDLVIKSFEEEYPQYPILENGIATFLYNGKAEKVRIAGDFTNWRPSKESFEKIEKTDLWYLNIAFDNSARLDYKLVINESEWILDPKNPYQISGGWGPNSELRMPGYIPAWELDSSTISEKGSLVEESIHSNILDKNYSLFIYLPAKYDPAEKKTYPVAYFQDGNDNIRLGNLPIVLDNLIEQKKIRPIIAVCIAPNDRESEYVTQEKKEYRKFCVSELIPFIDTKYNTITQADARAVIGASYGANISAQIAFSHPEIVSNCGVHSAAYQPENNKTRDFILENISKAVDYVAIWGSYEGAYPNNRAIRSAYQKAGIAHVSLEFPEGHSWGLWRATYDEMLIRFFPFSN